MQSWIQKYAPKHSSEIPQQESILKVRQYIESYKRQKKKALLIHGPSGSCKTVSIYALANESDKEVVEVNSSQARNADSINEHIGNALNQRSLFSTGKIILIDEVDALSGRKDRGGVSALTKLLATSTYPIILTANDAYNDKLKSLRKKAMLVEFPAPSHTDIFKILTHICNEEDLSYDESALKTLARACGGDVRAAINDLQTISRGKTHIDTKVLETLGERLKLESVSQALIRIFKNTDPKIALSAFDNVGQDLDKCALWIDENLPGEYTRSQDLRRAYEMTSRADVFRGRIRRWQYWRFLVYVNSLLTAGVATAKDARYKTQPSYKQPGRILKLWIAKMKYKRKQDIARKIARKTHCSTRRARQDVLPFIQAMFKDPRQAQALTDYLDLDGEEVAWLKK